jgi:hypothetical protein
MFCLEIKYSGGSAESGRLQYFKPQRYLRVSHAVTLTSSAFCHTLLLGLYVPQISTYYAAKNHQLIGIYNG